VSRSNTFSSLSYITIKVNNLAQWGELSKSKAFFINVHKSLRYNYLYNTVILPDENKRLKCLKLSIKMQLNYNNETKLIIEFIHSHSVPLNMYILQYLFYWNDVQIGVVAVLLFLFYIFEFYNIYLVFHCKGRPQCVVEF
jgi:hypothetical protein